jgi:PAS domain S-box-containing protein
MKHKPLLLRVTMALVCIQSSVLILASVVGLIPDRRAITMDGRVRLCESIAINCSYLISINQTRQLPNILERIAERNSELLSLGLRKADGKLLVELGEHQSAWGTITIDHSTDTHLFVPIYSGSGAWGQLEMCFKPIGATGWLAMLVNTQSILLTFSTAIGGSFIAYFLHRLFRSLLGGSRAAPQSVRSALDTLTEGLFVLDRDQKIVLANQAFCTISGMNAESLHGRKASSLPWLFDDGKAYEELPWVTALNTQTPQPNVLMRLQDSHGVQRSFNVNASPVLGKDGKYLGVLVSFDDITLLQQRQAELAAARAIAESANRAKSDFLANMSHEIRTPMNAILGFTEVMMRGYATSPTQQKYYLSTIRSSGKHLLNLINDILDLSKVEANRLEVERTDCNPQRIILDTLAVLSVQAEEKGISLTYSTKGPVPEIIKSDPTRLRQIVTNLLGNAVKFTSQGGVQVEAAFSSENDQPRLLIAIKDSGIGMSLEARGKIFQPFVQADGSTTRNFGGTGLGLVISKRFANALGGDIIVTSEPGKGSTFTVDIAAPFKASTRFLDASQAREVWQTEAAERDQMATTTSLPAVRILVVDDGEANRALLQLVLSKAGARVETVENGQEALDAVAESPDFDLILMDMQMPVLDGYTATGTLRERGFTRPIIALTGNAMLGDEERCRSAGCSGFLTKPIEIGELLTQVKGALEASIPAPGGIGPTSTTPLGEEVTEWPSTTATVSSGVANYVNAASTDDLLPTVIHCTLPIEDAAFLRIASIFTVKLERQLLAMTQAVDDAAWEQLAQLAHWLKGSGGTVGFGCFTKPAQNLERAALANDAQQCRHEILIIDKMRGLISLPDPEIATASGEGL